jgi:hypothetical protein
MLQACHKLSPAAARAALPRAVRREAR